jgi:molybdopterin biosynthesis enzyme
MKILTLEAGPSASPSFLGTVIVQTVTHGPSSKSIALRKGEVVDQADLETLRRIEPQPIRVVQLDEGDVHEDAAGLRLAKAIAGSGITLKGPTQSRVDLVASVRGVATIDAATINGLNLIPDVAIFTAVPYQPVAAGQVVAGAKVVPIVTRVEYLTAAEGLGAERGPAVQVKPYLPLKVGVVSKQRPDAKQRTRFEQVVQKKMSWFGASVVDVRFTNPSLTAVTEALEQVTRAGAELILTAGSSSADPYDSLVVAVEELGGSIEVRGTPTHPGSFFWLAYLDDRPVFGMPSCGAYSEATTVDLLLPRVMIGERPRRWHIAELGVGGLFASHSDARFPDYGLAAED